MSWDALPMEPSWLCSDTDVPLDPADSALMRVVLPELEALGQEAWDLVDRRVHEAWSWRELGDAIGLTDDAARKRFHTATATVRRRVEARTQAADAMAGLLGEAISRRTRSP